MDAQLDKILCAKYPSLLLGNTTQSHDQFFFECGDGWFNIINAALAVINNRATFKNLGVTVSQIKEKFGTLRIYCTQGDEFTTTACHIAELISESACEICGIKGSTITVNRWHQTRCEVHELTTAYSSDESTTVSEEYSANLAGAIESILGLFDSNPQWALGWLNKPLIFFGHDKPYEMLQSSEGCSALISFIGRLEHGVPR